MRFLSLSTFIWFIIIIDFHYVESLLSFMDKATLLMVSIFYVHLYSKFGVFMVSHIVVCLFPTLLFLIHITGLLLSISSTFPSLGVLYFA